jgi:eukaryotic-like serine/threonine-protein kinase
MIYDSLSGDRPFQGPLLQVLRDKQVLDPPPLTPEQAKPEDLAALGMRLLARDPDSRPDPLEIARAIASNLERSESVSPGPGPQHLVGRESQLAALADAYATMQRRDQPQTVFVVGRSGEGKSSLVEHFLGPMRADGRAVVMAGRCYDRESVPFKALDSLIDALASYLRALPETEAALLLPDDIGVLAVVFPVLQRVDVVARAAAVRHATIDEQQVRQRAFAALRSLLVRISRSRPVVCCIDDLQWGDADSAEAMFLTLRPPDAPRILFVGTYRSDEAEGSTFLKTWAELQRKHEVRLHQADVTLAPLTVEECTELVIRLVGKDDEGIRRRAAEFSRETRGNPFLLIELVGCFDPETDSFEHMPLHEVLGRKLGRLPDEAGHLLEVVVVSGQALSLEEASRTAGHETFPVATITRMRNDRLVRMVGTEDRPLVDTYHDRVRETILVRLDEGKRRNIHRRLAQVIEAGVGSDADELEAVLASWERAGEEPGTGLLRVYDLAYHYDEAGDGRRAWIYALLAGEQARRQSALEVAANNFAIARRNAERTSAPAAVRYRIAEGHGWVLMLLGRYDEATEALAGTIELARDAERKARIEALQGEIIFKQGLLDSSVSLSEEGLRRLGHWVPRSRMGLAYGILRELVIQGWHSLRPGRLHRQARSSRLDLAVHFLYRLTGSYAFQATPRAFWAHLTGMNLAESMPPSQQLALTYAFHDCFSAMLGWRSRGARYGDRGIAIARQYDNCWAVGQCCSYKGIGLYASARYEEGVVQLEEAIELFEKAGDLWELDLAHFHKGCCHFGLGDLAEAVREARWTFAASTRLGDSRTLCSSYLWARATRGNIPFEELRGCFPSRPDDVMSTVHGMMAEGYWHSFHGRTGEALDTFERAWGRVRTTLCVNSHMIFVLPLLASALRAHSDTIRRQDPLRSDDLRRRGYRMAWWAVRVTRYFPATYPMALRELSIQLADRGKAERALRVADRSCSVAEGQKARYERAQSLLVRGKIAHQLGRPEAEAQVRAAEAELEAIEGAMEREMQRTVLPQRV